MNQVSSYITNFIQPSNELNEIEVKLEKYEIKVLKILYLKESKHSPNVSEDETNETYSVQLPELNAFTYTEEELAAAYLTLFFKGKLTQSALSVTIELANITSSVKLPTSFDGLVNKIIKKNPKNKERNLDYDKTWFCGYCIKLTTVLERDRFQRECINCGSR